MSGADKPTLLSNGLSVYGITRSAVDLEQFFIGEYFDSDITFAPGMTVLDLGANIGLFSLELLRRYEGNVRIFACEPAPQTFAFLERNVRELFPDAQVSCICCAIGEQPGRSTLYYKPRFSTLSSLQREQPTDEKSLRAAALREPPDGFRIRRPRLRALVRPFAPTLLAAVGWWTGRKVVEVPCEVRTVSQIIRQSGIERIDLLKVDIEGAELAALRGIDAEDWPKIKSITAEVHDVGGRVETIRGMLESVGFDPISFSQEWPFKGTNMYMLDASRPADDTSRVSETSASPAISGDSDSELALPADA